MGCPPFWCAVGSCLAGLLPALCWVESALEAHLYTVYERRNLYKAHLGRPLKSRVKDHSSAGSVYRRRRYCHSSSRQEERRFATRQQAGFAQKGVVCYVCHIPQARLTWTSEWPTGLTAYCICTASCQHMSGVNRELFPRDWLEMPCLPAWCFGNRRSGSTLCFCLRPPSQGHHALVAAAQSPERQALSFRQPQACVVHGVLTKMI